jgi:hypothetical protein
MSTRGRLGIQLSDDSILSIYNHFDSYPDFLGVKLVEHFNTKEKVQELVDLGDISCIWTNLGFNNETLPETGPRPYSARGEVTEPRYDLSLKTYLANSEEYAYIFMNEQWVCYDLDGSTPKIVDIPAPAVTV